MSGSQAIISKWFTLKHLQVLSFFHLPFGSCGQRSLSFIGLPFSPQFLQIQVLPASFYSSLPITVFSPKLGSTKVRMMFSSCFLLQWQLQLLLSIWEIYISKWLGLKMFWLEYLHYCCKTCWLEQVRWTKNEIHLKSCGFCLKLCTSGNFGKVHCL